MEPFHINSKPIQDPPDLDAEPMDKHQLGYDVQCHEYQTGY